MKSKAEPNTWKCAVIIAILGRWNGTGVAFEFFTDGMLGPSAITVRQALADLKEPASSDVADRVGSVQPLQRKKPRSTAPMYRFRDAPQ